ncbi:MAG TPA: flagellar hook-length control protein FliK, partial [Candidatus Poseidoniales archaeon]|nr:flagellar hook-length control protein FliK [Candidatus Poseidoniales archaeon]
MHQSRYSGSPDTVMSGSGRGPTDDGRIKPDILAPGGYIRSCRAQEAQDTSGSSWTQQWYMEYTGTSMATPNAAGAAVLVREYLTEIALRPSPQGALVKALLVLGAEDIGSRNIPNNNEGWGRINLENSLAPSGNR